MAEPTPDFDRAAQEFRDAAGPLDYLAGFVQQGIEVEAFGKSPAGRVLIGRAVNAARLAIETILKPSTSGETLAVAVTELRVQHRVLQAYADAVRQGRDAQRRIISQDEEPEET